MALHETDLSCETSSGVAVAGFSGAERADVMCSAVALHQFYLSPVVFRW
jgi:hypothetical protein